MGMSPLSIMNETRKHLSELSFSVSRESLPEISTVSPATKPAFSNPSGVKSVFRKLCFVTEELVS